MFISNFESKFLQKSNYKIEEMELIDVALIKFEESTDDYPSLGPATETEAEVQVEVQGPSLEVDPPPHPSPLPLLPESDSESENQNPDQLFPENCIKIEHIESSIQDLDSPDEFDI